MVRLAGVVVEYTTYDLKDPNGRVLDQECVVNPTGCCEVGAGCFLGVRQIRLKMPQTLYFTPFSPHELLVYFRQGFGEANTVIVCPFQVVLESVYGPNAMEEKFPFPMPWDSVTERWVGKLVHGRGFETDPGNPGVWTWPYFYMEVSTSNDNPGTEQAGICTLFVKIVYAKDKLDFGFGEIAYLRGRLREFRAFPSILSENNCGFAGTTPDLLVVGYNKGRPGLCYLEYNCDNLNSQTQATPAVMPTSGGVGGFVNRWLLTDQDTGYEIPPPRTGICKNTRLPPYLKLNWTAQTNPADSNFLNGTHDLFWKHGCYQKTFTVQPATVPLKVFLGLYPNLQNYIEPAFVATWYRADLTPPSMAGSRATTTFLHYITRISNYLRTHECEPYYASGRVYANYNPYTASADVTITE